VPLYCFDPRQYALTPFGNPKTGAHRAQFLLESVLDLKASLRSIGSDLLIHLGRPEDVMSGACVAPAGAGSAYTHTAQALHLHAWRPAPGLALPPTRAPSPAQALCSRQPPGRSRPVRDLYARATEAHTVQAAAWHGARPGRRCAADLFPAPVGGGGGAEGRVLAQAEATSEEARVERAVRRAVRDRARLARPARAQRLRGPRQPARRLARLVAWCRHAPVRA